MFNLEEFNPALDSPCGFHEGASHTVRECSQFKKAFSTPEGPKRPKKTTTDSLRAATTTTVVTTGETGVTTVMTGIATTTRDRDEHDLPPPPKTGNPNGPFQPPT
jgi:hypothetical protein